MDKFVSYLVSANGAGNEGGRLPGERRTSVDTLDQVTWTVPDPP